MKLAKLNFTNVLIIFNIAAILLMLAPTVIFSLPNYVITGDTAYAYQRSLLISEDLKNIFYDDYPKFMSLLAASFTNILRVPLSASLLAITIFFALAFPLVAYKLTLKLTNEKGVSLLAALFSTITVVYTSANIGFLPIPQALSMVFLLLSLYFFVSRKPFFAGIFLALQIMTHPSYPLTILLLAVYSALEFWNRKKFSAFIPAGVTYITAFLISLPHTILLKFYAAKFPFALMSSMKYFDTMFSIFSLPVLIFPPLIIFFALHGMYIVRKQNLNYKFVSIFFLLVLFLSQIYFIDLSPIMLGQVSTPSRTLSYIFYPMSVLAAISLFSIFKSRKWIIAAAALAFMVVSIPYYWIQIEKFVVKMDDEDLQVVDALKSNEDFGKQVLYDPATKYGREHNIIYLAGYEQLDNPVNPYSPSRVLIGNSSKSIDSYPVYYVLENKDSTSLKSIIEKSEGLSLVFENSQYRLYKNANPSKNYSQSTLSDHLTAFKVFLDNHPKFSAQAGKLNFTQTFAVHVSDTYEKACIKFEGSLQITECDGSETYKISGNKQTIYSLFETYSVYIFTDRFLKFYERGDITLEPDNSMLMKISKIVKWVNLGEPKTYPNAIFGLAYALVS